MPRAVAAALAITTKLRLLDVTAVQNSLEKARVEVLAIRLV
jgi:hypothetical protein